MDSTPNPTTPPETGPVPTGPLPAGNANQRLTTLSSLIDRLDDGASTTPTAVLPDRVELEYQNKLVQVRLGLASALFVALRAKHAPTAAHCLRVALGCSSWGLLLDLEDGQRDELEVAALLHDIGKIGIPDRVLLKPGKLNVEEAATIDRHRAIGEQILSSCCASQNVLNIVKYTPAWYDGSRPGFDCCADNLPFGARAVSILDAFDAMTTDQVYRRAMSRERAMAELFTFSGTQFDPVLVEQFCDLIVSDQITLTSDMARRWLNELTSDRSNAFWSRRLDAESAPQIQATLDGLFHQKLLDSMHDGVVFVDTNLQIVLWNRAAERLTGLSSASVLQHDWAPDLIGMQDEHGERLTIENCPVAHALSSRTQTLRRLTVTGRGDERTSVDAHMVPVIGTDGVMHGATLLLHDASSQITLEERVQTLHVKATRDPLTNVANRAEFDRVHTEFVETHLDQNLPCSLIICDIDHFKNVNDTYGHQAGDEALVSFASLLQRSCRPGDLVARYGGEEFVMLCADCDNATVTQRAEKIRVELESTMQPSLDDRPITASFGVTEIQAGDTPETMLRRADRALLRAKESGRNRVIQLGSGIPQERPKRQRRPWLRWFQPTPSNKLLEETLITAVPLPVTMEKLRGFVSDHHADIVATEDGKLQLQITKQSPSSRRTTDRPISFILSLQFTERHSETEPVTRPLSSRTMIHVTMRLTDNRDRRIENAHDRARQLFASLKSYFMAQTFEGQFDPGESAPNLTLFKRLREFIARWGHGTGS